MLHQNLKKYLKELDKSHTSIDGEHVIAEKIQKIFEQDKQCIPTEEDMAEKIAFVARENLQAGYFGWNTPYLWVLRKDEESQINQSMLQYWTDRARISKNPILESRYAGLVVDYFPKILKKNADVEMSRIIIEANIHLCKNTLVQDIYRKAKIRRALVLAIKINDKDLVRKAKDATIELEDEIAIDDKPGLWGFSFEWFLLKLPDKVELDETEKEKLVRDVEDRLDRIKKNVHAVEWAVSLLADYYAKIKDEQNLMRVLGILEDSIKKDEYINSNALVAHHRYHDMYEMYRNYAGRFPAANKASKRMLQEIGQLDLDWEKDMQTISYEFTKKEQEQMEEWRRLIFEDSNDANGFSGLQRVMARIVLNYIPISEDELQQHFKAGKGVSLYDSLPSQSIFADDGRLPVATLPSLMEGDNNYNSHFNLYATRHISFGYMYLYLALTTLQERFSQYQVADYFHNSFIFQKENGEYIKKAISAYWTEDYIVSSHLFVSLIESGIREMVRLSGGSVMKPNNLNGFDYIPLGRLLHDNQDILDVAFPYLKKHNIVFYLRLLLTEKTGMNLRNWIAHGIDKKRFFQRIPSDMLFHVLILLSIIQVKKDNDKNSSSRRLR